MMPSDSLKVRAPLSAADARALKIGDVVVLDGDVVVSAGLPTHARLVEDIAAGRPPPLDLHGVTFLHLGVASQAGHDGRLIPLYANPTTSTRFDAFMPTLIRHFGLHAVGGKGGLAQASAEAMMESGCVYLSFPGGGSPVLTEGVSEVMEVHWIDYVSHFRLSRLRVQGLGPAIVSIDAHGNNLYQQLMRDAGARMTDIRAQLNRSRAQSP